MGLDMPPNFMGFYAETCAYLTKRYNLPVYWTYDKGKSGEPDNIGWIVGWSETNKERYTLWMPYKLFQTMETVKEIVKTLEELNPEIKNFLNKHSTKYTMSRPYAPWA